MKVSLAGSVMLFPAEIRYAHSATIHARQKDAVPRPRVDKVRRWPSHICIRFAFLFVYAEMHRLVAVQQHTGHNVSSTPI